MMRWPKSRLLCNSIPSTLILIGFTFSSAGCSSLWRPEAEKDENVARLQELMKAPPPPDLVREAAVANGLHAIQVDGVGAVDKLPGTGGPADPSAFRDELIEDMKRHDIVNPNRFLEEDTNALVRVRALILPGARRGDPVDIRVLAPKESQAENLDGGWLLDTRLRRQIRLQKRMLQSSVKSGDVLAIATGPVLTRASHTAGDDLATRIEGNVISGGRVQEDRKLSLVLRPQYQHVQIALRLAEAINQRFFFFDGTTRRGIANPREDDLIEIEIHPRYRDNVYRLMEVVRAIGVEPESSKTQTRLASLAEQLTKPDQAADAAVQLEALGETAVPTLINALKTDNPELRFYAAEALAYLDRTECVPHLEQAAMDEAAFRAPALMALQGFKHHSSTDALRRLMSAESLETRYGSFCSLRRRRDTRPELGGQSLGAFWLYHVPTPANSAVVVSLRESSELVLFGDPPPIEIDQYIRGPAGILIKNDLESIGTDGKSTRLNISRFQVGEEDRRATSTTSVNSMITALAAVGASYGNTIEILRMMKDSGALRGQLAVDPLPRSLRTYYRDADPDSKDDASDEIVEM